MLNNEINDKKAQEMKKENYKKYVKLHKNNLQFL